MSPTENPECASYLMLRKQDRYIDESIHRTACLGNADWQIEGKHYCLMHAPTKDKSEEFEQALKVKLAVKDYNFRGAWFPENVSFRKYNFEEEVNFGFAEFSGSADFGEAQFSGGVADFSKAQFRGGDADFSKAQFSGGASIFSEAQFSGGPANFIESQFSGGDAHFREAQFSGGYAEFFRAQFSGGRALFMEVQFSGGVVIFSEGQFSGGDAHFEEANFSGGNAYFDKVKFSGNASFRAAQFSKTAGFSQAIFVKFLDFGKAVFERAVFFDKSEFKAGTFTNFRLTRFMDFVRLMDMKIEKGAEFYFGQATFEKPERVHFHSVELRPRWFISLDIRKFNFESIVFPLLKKRNAAVRELEKTQQLLKQLKEIRGEGELMEAAPPDKLLITAYHRLAANAEENNRYEEAMGFRYLAMETKRRSGWWRRWLPVTLHWWYWASSGYGERALRAGVMLFLIWLIHFGFYASRLSTFEQKPSDRDWILSFIVGAGGAAPKPDQTQLHGLPSLTDAAFYSLNVMAFQKPEPKPANESWLTRLVVTLQTILGPVQATLLLLAIRRKFMR
jgi:uncharacterized protein YjbI with pentapeptide repeats